MRACSFVGPPKTSVTANRKSCSNMKFSPHQHYYTLFCILHIDPAGSMVTSPLINQHGADSIPLCCWFRLNIPFPDDGLVHFERHHRSEAANRGLYLVERLNHHRPWGGCWPKLEEAYRDSQPMIQLSNLGWSSAEMRGATPEESTW